MKQCPNCEETSKFQIERSPDGDTICLACGFTAKHEVFEKQPEQPEHPSHSTR